MIKRIAGLALGIAAVTMLVSGCGGGGDDEDDAPTAVPTAVATAPAEEDETPEASGESETVAVDQDFWHSGWQVELGDAAFEPGDSGATVTIEAVFNNLGTDTSTFDSQTILIAGGENYEAERFAEGLPEVPGGLSGNGEFVFDVNDDFSFDDAVLRIGNAQNNQALVPIGPDATEELVTLEPQAVVVTGTATAGAVTVTLEGAEVRVDLPDAHSITEKGSTTITIRFSATPSAGIQLGQGVLQSENVALRLPDGTAVAVRSDGRSGVNEILQGKEGTTIPDLSVRFEIPSPAAGEYGFILRGNYGPGGAMAEGELAFTIP